MVESGECIAHPGFERISSIICSLKLIHALTSDVAGVSDGLHFGGVIIAKVLETPARVCFLFR